MTTLNQATTLAGAIWPAREEAGRAATVMRWFALVLAGSMFMALSAQIAVPIGPVPISMQTFGALMIGAAFGWRLGGATLVAYIAEGAMGLPVFANGFGGIAPLMGPSGGYIFGFLAAAIVVGALAERGWVRTPVLAAAAMLIGNIVIYAFGVPQLMLFVDGFEKAIAVGVAPFLLGDALKLALAVILLPVAWKVVSSFHR
jgi:biotin transport system substrate-specific component